jgi:hypothetical protein
MTWPDIFAILATEEGLTDSQILDLTPARLTQKVRAHLKRRKEVADFQLKISETQTKLICMWSSQSQEALQSARKISFTGEREPEEKDVGGTPGTAERLMGLFGPGGSAGA